jgi:hypothetical protein
VSSPAQPSAGSAAVVQTAQSAIRGSSGMLMVDSFAKADATPSQCAKQAGGEGLIPAPEVSFRTTIAVLQRWRRWIIVRSNKSPLVTTSVMAVRIVGRMASRIVSSASVYSVRFVSAPPVDNRQSASDNELGMEDRLS